VAGRHGVDESTSTAAATPQVAGRARADREEAKGRAPKATKKST
jgi:hypothetical protein